MTLPSVEPDFTKPSTILASFTRPQIPHKETVEELKSVVASNSEKLTDLDLSGIDLSGARFPIGGTDLTKASLIQANLSGADLSGADLRGADLSRARNLTRDHLNSARGDDTTKIPADLVRPSHWTASTDQ